MKHISEIMTAVCKEHGITMNQGDREMNKYCISKPYSYEGEGRIEVVKYHDEIVEGELAVLEGLIDHFKSMDHWPACEGAYPIKIHRLDEWSDKITKQKENQ